MHSSKIMMSISPNAKKPQVLHTQELIYLVQGSILKGVFHSHVLIFINNYLPMYKCTPNALCSAHIRHAQT